MNSFSTNSSQASNVPVIEANSVHHSSRKPTKRTKQSQSQEPSIPTTSENVEAGDASNLPNAPTSNKPRKTKRKETQLQDSSVIVEAAFPKPNNPTLATTFSTDPTSKIPKKKLHVAMDPYAPGYQEPPAYLRPNIFSDEDEIPLNEHPEAEYHSDIDSRSTAESAISEVDSIESALEFNVENPAGNIHKKSRLQQVAKYMRQNGLPISEHWISCEVPYWALPSKGETRRQMQHKLQLHHYLRHLRDWDPNGFERIILDIQEDSTQDVNRAISIAYGLALAHRTVYPPIFNYPGERIHHTNPRNHLPALPRTSNPPGNSSAVENVTLTPAPPASNLLGTNISLAGRRLNPQCENAEHPPTGGVQIINSRDISSKVVSGQLDPAKMRKLRDHLDMEIRNNRTPALDSLMTPDSLSLLSSKLAAHGKIHPSDITLMKWYSQWDFGRLISALDEIFAEDPTHTLVNKDLLFKDAIRKATNAFSFDIEDIEKMQASVLGSLTTIYLNLHEPTATLMPELLKLLFEGMRRNRSVTAENFEKSVKAYLESEPYPEAPLWLHLLSAVEKTFLDIRRDIATMAKWKGLGNTNSSKSNSSNHNNSKNSSKTRDERNKSDRINNKESKGSRTSDKRCRGCGMFHAESECDMKSHPDYNTNLDSVKSWEETPQYAHLLKHYSDEKDAKRRHLKRFVRLNGDKLPGYLPPESRNRKRDSKDDGKSKSSASKKGNDCNNSLTLADMADEFTNIQFHDDDYLYCTISTGTHQRPVLALIDSGAIHADYCSEEVAKWIRRCQQDNPLLHPCKLDASKANLRSVSRLANSDSYITSSGMVSSNFVILNELTKTYETLPCLNFKVIKTDIDIIIGRPTIRKFLLARKLPSVFDGITSVEPRPTAMVRPAAELEILPEPTLYPDRLCFSCNVPTNICIDCAPDFLGAVTVCESNTAFLEELQGDTPSFIFGSSNSAVPRNDGSSALGEKQPTIRRLSTVDMLDRCCGLSAEQAPTPRAKPTTIHRSEFLGDPIKDDEILAREHPIDNLFKDELPSDELLDLITIEGSPALQTRLKALCREFRDIFSTTVRADPAKVPEMSFKIDLDKWQHKRNRLPPRVQSPEKQREILKQIKLLLELDIIEVSTASEWSQVHMVPKPNSPGEWRITIDFVKLNEATIGMEGWPITIISALFQRLGAKRHKYFGVLDMTSGYFQGPLAPECRANSAFITLFGLYQWKRCPMGLKGAGQYFQRVMSSTVLAGLIYDICELYIDDVLISGENELSYLTNVKSVFQRFREFGVVVHPKKAKLGLTELEYVGHLIDHTGMHFSKEKRLEVLNFPQPTTQKHVQMFLGLANYFRDHVARITELLAPLREMIEDYDKRKKVIWTPEREAAFEKAKTAIFECQKLFFIDESATPILQTDASDYGIGGMLYQIVNGIMHPIMYISKALQGSQYNWSTIEKECYAIFFCINKLKPILGNSHFILKTDHKNLTAFKDHEKNCKVTRWKHSLMEENFSIEYVPGTEYHQTVPDALSRLVDDFRPNKRDILTNLSEDMMIFEKINMIVGKKAVHIPNDIYIRISPFHNTSVGHFAAPRVLERMKAAGAIDFNYPIKWISLFVAQCPCCQLLDRIKLRIKTRPFVTSALKPFQIVCLDHIGPIELNGEVYYILVIIDCFSRWVELYSVRSTTALETAKCLFEYYGRYGSAETISSDRGPAFFNELVQELVELGGSDYQYTTPYSHEENGIIERHNAEVIRHLRAIVFDQRVVSDVVLCLPIIQRIMNTLEKVLTGLTPAEMLFGNNLRLSERIFNRRSDSTPVKLSEYMDKLLSRQETILKVAREKQEAKDAFHMQEAEANSYSEYPINSYVLYSPPVGKKRNKVRMTHDGPFQVINKIGDIYTIENLVTGKPFDCHITSLRPFIFDPLRVNPKEVAVQNNQEFYIEKILAHRGNPKKRTTMEFQVRWLGYSSDHDSWEPYSNLRDTDQLIDYLKTHRLKSLIQHKHKQP